MSEPYSKDSLKSHPTVKALTEHQARLGLSNVAFGKLHLKLSGSTWGLIKNGDYAAMAKSLDGVLDACDAALAVLNDQVERTATIGDVGLIVDLDHVRAAIAAVKSCSGAPQNRLVVYLAPSGGGKTTLARRLSETYLSAAIRVEATETWRTSYFNALCEILRAAGVVETFHNPRDAESALLDVFAVEGRILVIDEGHYCGPAALNLLKLLLNRTTTRIVLLSIPQLWSRLEQAAYEEALQLRRRTAAKIIVKSVSREHTRAILAVRLPGFAELAEDEKHVVAKVEEEANKFGLFDTIDRICAEVSKEVAGAVASLDIIKSAAKRVEALRS